MTMDKAMDMNKLNKTPETAMPDFLLSRDPEKAMQEMMIAIDDLKMLYLEENEALMSSDLKTFLKLQDKKVALADRYEKGSKQLQARKHEFENIEEAKKERLIKLQEEFVEIAKTNLEALDQMRGSVKRLSDRIMTTAKEAIEKENAKYGSGGILETGQRAVSIGINESA